MWNLNNTQGSKVAKGIIEYIGHEWGSRHAIQEAINAHLPSVEVPKEAATVMQVQPEALNVGDIVQDYGFRGRIEHISVFENKDDIPTYGVYVSYVSGRLDQFLLHRASICNGCLTGELAYIQGNARRAWFKVA